MSLHRAVDVPADVPAEPEAWLALLRRQDGLVTREQVFAQGLSYETIRANLAAGRWQTVGYGVYATYTGPLSEDARRRAAVLEHWPCALSHRTAGEMLRLCGPDPSAPIHVVVAYGSSAVSSMGAVVHRTRAFEHILVDTDPPTVSRARTAVDLAVAEANPHDAMRTMLHCLVVGGLTPPEVLAAIELRRPWRWKRALIDAVRYAAEGVTSKLELLYALDVEEAHGLPPAVRQLPVAVDGVRRFEDVSYRVGDRTAIVRLDGHEGHANRATALTDRRRDTAALLDGHARMVVGWPEARHHPCRTAQEVGAMLESIGWDGGLRPCARCVGL